MYEFAIRTNLVKLILFYLLFVTVHSLTIQSKREIKYGKASLVLYQGKLRHEIQGANCPVGVSFLKPERFSCACVNGVWAFYNVMCDLPLAVVGGHNYCFQMPESYIQQVTVISNPLRPLEDTLAIFEGEQEAIRTKVYRNLHLPIEDTNFFLALNSSWTLKSAEGNDEVCLNSRFITSLDDPTFLKSMYCNFANISKIMPSIGAILKGCNAKSRKIEPIDCQPILAPNSEAICSSAPVLEAYTLAEKEFNDVDSTNRSIRSFQRRWKHTTTVPTTPSTSTTTTTTTTTTLKTTTTKKPMEITDSPITEEDITTRAPVHPASGRRVVGRKKVVKTGRQSLGKSEDTEKDDSGGPDLVNVDIPPPLPPSPEVKSETGIENESDKKSETIEKSGEPRNITDKAALPDEKDENLLSETEMIRRMNLEWDSRENFLIPPIVKSEPIIMNQIWKYEKIIIQDSVGHSVEDPYRNNSQIVRLILISKDIMAKICPIVSEEYFKLALETFIAVQKKDYHWKEPYISYNDFLRIYAALSACKDRARPFKFVNTKSCITRNPEKLKLGHGDNITEVNIKEKIPEDFKSTGYEPIIESVWKIVVSTHSYCFSDFDDYYNDHHKYTVALLPIFLNDINKLWFDHRNKVIDEEYAGALGNTQAILDDIDKCASATRLVSDYPFDLSRPAVDNDVKSNEGLVNNPSNEENSSNQPVKTDNRPGSSSDSINKAGNGRALENKKGKMGRQLTPVKRTTNIRRTRSLADSSSARSHTDSRRVKRKQDTDAKKKPGDLKAEDAENKNSGIDRKRRMVSSKNVNSAVKKSASKSVSGKPQADQVETWKKSRLTLKGLGYCLKKYDEPKKFLDQNCEL